MRAVITGGAGFLGSHLCDYLIERGWDVLSIDNLVTGREANVAHLMKHPRFRMMSHDISRYIEVAGPVDYVLNFASPASPPDYLKLPIQTLKVGALGTHNTLGPGAGEEGQVLPRFHLGVLWGSADYAAAGKLLGKREPHRAARRLRRSQALCRSDGHGLSPLPWRGYPHRAHLQYLRTAHAPE